jgi:copper transport protein
VIPPAPVLILLTGMLAQGEAPGLQTAGAGTVAGLLVARLANVLGLALVTGLLLCAGVLLPARDGGGLSPAARRALRAAGMVALLWAASGVALFVFGLSNAAARPLPEALDPALAARFAGTRFGSTVVLQAVAALVVAALAWATRDPRGALVPLVAVAAAATAPVWWGHAPSADLVPVALASHWVHILGASGWAGGLAALAWLVLRDRAGVVTGAELAGAVRSYSRLAGGALVAVLATGVVNTLLHLGGAANLLTTSWGRLALVKFGLFGAIAALGWRSRTVWVPRLTAAAGQDATAGRARFQRVALLEVGVMVLAFGAAAGMSSGMPAEAEAAARIQSVTTALGDGQVNLTLDPGRAGPNELHVYVFGPDGALRRVEDLAITFTSGGETVEAALLPSGPGHFTGLGVTIPHAGAWAVAVQAEIDGQPVRATTAFTVR